jgi:hypothetical protein
MHIWRAIKDSIQSDPDDTTDEEPWPLTQEKKQLTPGSTMQQRHPSALWSSDNADNAGEC